jgi:S-adenosylmethionine synthetase
MFRQGLNGRDIVVDLTGGKATLLVAAFIAADVKRIDSQYLVAI